jgi:hypothetical protein
MESQLKLEIQRRLSQYLSGETALHDFEGWFVPTLWSLADSNDEAARELAGSIENLIAETSRGDRTPESLQEKLSCLASPLASSNEPNCLFDQAQPHVFSETRNLTLRLSVKRIPKDYLDEIPLPQWLQGDQSDHQRQSELVLS